MSYAKDCDWCGKHEGAQLEYTGSHQHKYQVKEGFLSYKVFCSEKCKQNYLNGGDNEDNESSNPEEDSWW